MMMNCLQCNAENSDSARFCRKCGQSLISPSPTEVLTPIVPETNCPQCNAPKAEGAKFCGKCGYRFEVNAGALAAAAATEAMTARPEPGGYLSAEPKAAESATPVGTDVPKNNNNNLIIVAIIALVAILGAGGTGWYLWSKPAVSTAAFASVPAGVSDGASTPPASGGSASARERDAYGNPVKPEAATPKNKGKTEPRRDIPPRYPAQPAAPHPAESVNIDAQYQQRAAAECDSGMSGLFCREKVRYRLCKNHWSASPPPGQSLCQRVE